MHRKRLTHEFLVILKKVDIIHTDGKVKQKQTDKKFGGGRKMERKNTKEMKKRGITLVSLVITVVILLILAGVAITLAIDSNGLFARAGKAANKWNASVAEEQQAINEILAEMEDSTIKKNEPNKPKLAEGMTPIKFVLPQYDALQGIDTEGSVVETTENDSNWYNYNAKQWANAKTEDGSMWVWIPRYAYRINEETQTTEVVFLRGTSDNYYDTEGNIQTAKRATTETEAIDTTEGFTVHPAFTNESSINYRNGGWNAELEGIWVAKFEAGYASGNNNAPVVASSVNYTQTTSWVKAVENGTSSDTSIPARNWLDGVYAVKIDAITYEWKDGIPTAIKYPTFQPVTYSMNNISYEDAFNMARALTEENNIYGFNSSTDTHLMKDSEWGMVAYLSQSQYGLNGTNISINNISLNSGSSSLTKEEGNNLASVYAVTGCTTGTSDAEELIVENFDSVKKLNGNVPTENGVYVWNQVQGQTASSTGNMYGIYDLSGGVLERTASYVGNERYKDGIIWNGSSYIKNEYLMQYAYDSEKDNVEIGNDASGETTKLDIASTANYALAENARIYGNAIHETSTAGTETSSWYNDYSYFPALYFPISTRGGDLWITSYAGLFCLGHGDGNGAYIRGFRPVVIV